MCNDNDSLILEIYLTPDGFKMAMDKITALNLVVAATDESESSEDNSAKDEPIASAAEKKFDEKSEDDLLINSDQEKNLKQRVNKILKTTYSQKQSQKKNLKTSQKKICFLARSQNLKKK